MTDLLDRLRDVDPFAHAALPPLAFASVSDRQARERTLRRRRRRGFAGAGVVLLAVATVALVLGGSPGKRVPEALAAQTFAAVDPAGAIVHFTLDRRDTLNGHGARFRTERWHSATRQRTVQRFGKSYGGGRVQSDVNGRTIRSYDAATGTVTISRVSGRSASAVGDDPFMTYRERFRDGAVRDIGPATFEGRRVRRLQIQAGPRRITYFLPRTSAVPIAIEVVQRPMQYTISPDGRRGSTRPVPGAGLARRITRILEYERLPDTPENRKLLVIRLPPGTRTVHTPQHPPLPAPIPGP